MAAEIFNPTSGSISPPGYRKTLNPGESIVVDDTVSNVVELLGPNSPLEVSATTTNGPFTPEIERNAGGAGGLTLATEQSGDFVMAAGNLYPVDGDSGPIGAMLPENPEAGDEVGIVEISGSLKYVEVQQNTTPRNIIHPLDAYPKLTNVPLLMPNGFLKLRYTGSLWALTNWVDATRRLALPSKVRLDDVGPDLSGDAANQGGLTFNPTGTVMLVSAWGPGLLLRYPSASSSANRRTPSAFAAGSATTASFPGTDPGIVQGLEWNDDGTVILAAAMSNIVRSYLEGTTPYDIGNLSATNTLDTSSDHSGTDIKDVELSSDGMKLFVGVRAGEILLLEYALGTKDDPGSATFTRSIDLNALLGLTDITNWAFLNEGHSIVVQFGTQLHHLLLGSPYDLSDVVVDVVTTPDHQGGFGNRDSHFDATTGQFFTIGSEADRVYSHSLY